MSVTAAPIMSGIRGQSVGLYKLRRLGVVAVKLVALRTDSVSWGG